MFLVIALIFGIICAVIASYKGRSAVAWFFIGFFIGIIGLILVLVVSNLKEAEQKQAHVEMEQRRLHEQLRQERLKTEQLRKYTQVRLDAHDRKLEIDTRHVGPLLQEASKQPILDERQGSFAEAIPIEANIKRGGWYYQKRNSAVGPLSLETVKLLIQDGRIKSSTCVWHESLDEWTPARKVGELGTETDRG